MSTKQAELSADQAQLLSLINGFRATQAIYVVARLGVADMLADGPLTAEAIAVRAGVNPASLRRVLRLAAFFGVVEEVPPDRFGLTALGAGLRGDQRDSLRALAVLLGAEHYGAWGALMHTVKTGESAFPHVYGSPMFEWLADHPAAQQEFDAAMVGNTDLQLAPLVQVYDFSAARVIVDVGGGSGSVAAAVLTAYPGLRAVIYDQPQVLAGAERFLRGRGLFDRCTLAPGSFFESVPSGGDVYLLSHIVHDWDDERALKILKNCRRAVDGDARLLLLEAVMAPHGHPSAASLADVNMMVLLTGRERTEGEFRSLLAQAGFELVRVAPLSERRRLLEARPT